MANKVIRISVLIAAAIFLLYNYYSNIGDRHLHRQALVSKKQDIDKGDNTKRSNDRNEHKELPEVALIFDNMGESVRALRDIYSLKIPLSISIVPGLKFSRNVAYIAKRCRYSVLIQLPLGRKNRVEYQAQNYGSTTFVRRDIDKILRYYLNYLRIAVGIEAHISPEAEKNTGLMMKVLEAAGERRLVFINAGHFPCSTEFNSLAGRAGVKSSCSVDLIGDSTKGQNVAKIIDSLVNKSREGDGIVITVYPDKKVLDVLKKEIPELKKQVSFVTIEEYFGLQ